MARPREFDPDEAIVKATGTFWRLGYHNTSLDALTSEMGIARQSLYDTFGDKRELYLLALRYYRDGNHAMLRHLFESTAPVRDGFAYLLYGLAAESRSEHERGCLLLSANMQHAADDTEVADFLRENQRITESIFASALRRALHEGEIAPSSDPDALARYFVVTIQGMRAIARLESNRVALEQVAKVALGVFG